jgi:transposase
LGQVRVDSKRPGGAVATADLIADVLKRSTKPLTTKELAAAIKADTGVAVNEQRLREALRRHSGRFEKTGDVPYRYGIRKAETTATQGSENDLDF